MSIETISNVTVPEPRQPEQLYPVAASKEEAEEVIAFLHGVIARASEKAKGRPTEEWQAAHRNMDAYRDATFDIRFGVQKP